MTKELLVGQDFAENTIFWQNVLETWKKRLLHYASVMHELPSIWGERSSFGFFKQAVVQVNNKACLLEEYRADAHSIPDAYLVVDAIHYMIECKDNYYKASNPTSNDAVSSAIKEAHKQLKRYVKRFSKYLPKVNGLAIVFCTYGENEKDTVKRKLGNMRSKKSSFYCFADTPIASKLHSNNEIIYGALIIGNQRKYN